MAQASAETSWHLPALLEQAAQRWPERPFLLSGGDTTISYGEASERVKRVAASLQSMGVGRGDRVMMVCANREELVVLAFATLRVGAIFVILSPETRTEGFSRIVTQCEPKVIMLDASSAGLYDGSIPTQWIRAEQDFASLLETDGSSSPEFPGIDQDPAFLVFTSGSTGTPRGVILSHDNVRFATAAIQARVQYVETDRIGVFLPMSFDYGLYQLFLAMQAGAAVFLGRPEMVGPEFARTLALRGITVLPGVPTLFSALIKLQSWRPVQMPALRM
ncbi:MAG TPA: AMP-binding protein, partial [Candidatus Saccharimonadia bacterium]|nr:AMP-binding protein [Candidatus Saccharimonadia bacterium]